MGLHRITRGLDLPLSGAPGPAITDAPAVSRVAIVADDFPGWKPRLLVQPGDRVFRGQPVIEDRARPGVVHTAPGGGVIEAVHRGKRRVLLSVVITLSADELEGRTTAPPLHQGLSGPETLTDAAVRELLVTSGLWTALRTRPFARTPDPTSTPAAVFVTAIDTNPLAPDPETVLAGHEDAFQLGLRLVAKLTPGATYLCVRGDSTIAERIDAPVRVERFDGPHPAGTAGLHIHLLEPVGRHRTVWTIGYQDIASLGRLAADGQLDVSRVVSIAGPPVRHPRVVRTRSGASIDELIADEPTDDRVRWIAGSVWSGKAAAAEAHRYVGRFDVQITALHEGDQRPFLGWLGPGRRRFSTLPIFLSSLVGGRRDFTTSLEGSRRAMVPIGTYERVMPFDLVPTVLLRALAVEDVERVEELGGLELAEEDLALCTFVDPGKADYGPLLRRVLDRIEAEG